ncbi:hypothetical protein [Jiangella anatolica]|uniref:Uncharacterized protein n=1 Tax=Jiangella anatolica TaxID=2670374 RepID=A0A2W2CJ47_9ACTN|nr:hypothetical protein [Jiangella anatolica]PZF80253.1 hypothetical protein C1I92_27145 [Jiangella anatolica]
MRAASTGPAPAGAAGRAEGPARRSDDSVVGQLNAEWIRLCADPSSAAVVERWRIGGVGALSDLEAAVRRDADGVLLALLRLGRSGDALASRSVLQLMLGKAVRIAAGHVGRDSRASLEQAAVTALWTVVAGYPVERRPVKVAANIAMDTLRLTVDELAYQRHETPADPEQLHAAAESDVPAAAAHVRGRSGASDTTGTAGSASGNRTAEGAGGRGVDRTAGTGRAIGAAGSGGASGRPGDRDPVGVPGSGDGPGSAGAPDLELYELLAWAVGNATISRDDALLLVDIYAPAPGCPGGKAAAERRGISWAAARQRASRATRRIAEAVRADDPTASR